MSGTHGGEILAGTYVLEASARDLYFCASRSGFSKAGNAASARRETSFQDKNRGRIISQPLRNSQRVGSDGGITDRHAMIVRMLRFSPQGIFKGGLRLGYLGDPVCYLETDDHDGQPHEIRTK